MRLRKLRVLDAPPAARPVARRLTLLPLLVAALLASPAAVAQLSDDERAAAVTEIASLLHDRYVFPETGAACQAALREELGRGDFDGLEAEALARVLTTRLQELTGDRHLRVNVRAPGEALGYEHGGDEEQELERMRRAGRPKNFGFEQALRLPGNVGYLDLRGFLPTGVARDTAVGAMNYLGHCDALIFDLRQNGGGDPQMVQLLSSYLFDEPTHLNSLYWRENDETQEFWTLDEVPGPRLADVPVFILTSAYTFSAAEEFTYNLQTRERAVVVGETTGGGAHPGGSFPVGERFAIFVSLGRAINPITGDNWEGTGIRPDVAVPADAAMDEAVKLATEAARTHREARAG